jgi:hypothetical protein
MRKTGRWLFSFLLCSLPAWAEFEFFQFVDKTTVDLEETFQLHIVVSNPPSNAQMEFPPGKDFEVLSRSQSTQFQYGTGRKLQKEQRYSFVLRANKEGQLVIPPALLKAGNNLHKTETLTLHVTRNPTAPSPSPGGNASKNTPLVPRSDSDLFLQMTLDKSSAYVGEQVLLSLQVYSRLDITLQPIPMLTPKGFLSEDLEVSWPPEARRKSVDGVHYHVATLRKQALFAIQPGTYTIEPATVNFIVRQLFGGREVRRESNALTLEVKALPSAVANLPVGQWTLELRAPQGPLTAGQPVELSLTLRGTGNIRHVPPLELPFPDSFKTFQPTIQNNTQTLDNKLLGSRTMQYVVIPQKAGNFTVPTVKFDYFNAETEQAETTQTSPLTWVVLPGNADGSSENTATHAPAPTAAPGLGFSEQEKIHPIRHKALLTSPSTPLTQKNIYWVFVALPISLRLLGMLVQLALSQMGSSAKRQQRQREKSALHAIRASVSALKTNPCAASFSRLGKNVMAFLECKLGASTQGLTQEQLLSKMREQGFPEPICKQILSILGECDAVQFGHAPLDSSSINRVCEATLHALKGWV